MVSKNKVAPSSLHILEWVSFLIIVIGVGLFYKLDISSWIKWIIVLACLLLAGAIFFGISELGTGLHSYFLESWRELSKVVWPTRKEAIQFTWIIFLFVAVLALFLWLVDSSLSWLFYSVILGK